MHYKAEPIEKHQTPGNRGVFDPEAQAIYYERARDEELIALVRGSLMGRRPRTSGIELLCEGHSTGCAVYLHLVVREVGRGLSRREDTVVAAKYYPIIKLGPGDTWDDIPAIRRGDAFQSVTIRCMHCGREQKRKAVYGLDAAAAALKNARDRAGKLSCDWMI